MLRILCLSLVLLWPGLALANPLGLAEALIRQEQTAEARAILDAYEPTTRAEQERKLWALAVAYGQEGRPRRAITYLEQLISLNPRSARYRLELAGALMAIEQDERAHYHYSLLRSSVTDPGIAAVLDDRLDRLERRKAWEGYLSIALTPESNAARRTAADTVVIAGLPFRINPNARARSATGVRLVFGGALLPMVAPDTRARIGLTFDGRFFNSDRAPDDYSVIGQLGLVNFGDRSRQAGATVHFARRWIDGDLYSDTTGITLRYSRLTGTSGSILVSARYQRIDYDNPRIATADETRLQLRYSHNITPRFQVYGSGFAEFRDSPTRSDKGTNFGLALGTQYLFQGGLQVGLELEQSRLKRDGVSPLFGTRRKDDRRMATLRLSNRNWNFQGFTPVLELGYETQDSSIPLYTYDNTRLALGVTRRF